MTVLEIGIGRKGVDARKLWPQIHRFQSVVLGVSGLLRGRAREVQLQGSGGS